MDTATIIDLNAPLRWTAEGGHFAEAVRDIPKTGMVYFYDADGPVHRQENIDEARWWVFGKGEKRVRITRLESAGRYTYLVPGIAPAVECNHGCPAPGQCGVVATMARGLLHEGELI